MRPTAALSITQFNLPCLLPLMRQASQTIVKTSRRPLPRPARRAPLHRLSTRVVHLKWYHCRILQSPAHQQRSTPCLFPLPRRPPPQRRTICPTSHTTLQATTMTLFQLKTIALASLCEVSSGTGPEKARCPHRNAPAELLELSSGSATSTLTLASPSGSPFVPTSASVALCGWTIWRSA